MHIRKNLAVILAIILFIKNKTPNLDIELMYKILTVGLIGLCLVYIPKYLKLNNRINVVLINVMYPLITSIVIFSNIVFAISCYLILYAIHFDKFHKSSTTSVSDKRS